MRRKHQAIVWIVVAGMLAVPVVVLAAGSGGGKRLTYPIVDTGQTVTYDESSAIGAPEEGEAFYGQDAQNDGLTPAYVDNGDGTVTDLNTGLMWQQDPGEKMTYAEAVAGVDSFRLAGYDDWRLPSIKELFSLIDFSGTDPSGCQTEAGCEAVPFIDTDFFDFQYGDTSAGERLIDSQWATSTIYQGLTMGGNETMFGVNFADGRIKGYPISDPRGGEKEFFVIYVRGNPDYGENDFVDNGDGTVTDEATGLMWQQDDSGSGMEWADALSYCEALDLGGYDDWTLPDVKQLQSIVDYTRSPSASGSAAIDPVFETSTITDEAGDTNWPFFWSSTTHASQQGGNAAAYVAFGEALGWMQDSQGGYELMNVHGAGAQRSDPKTGDAGAYPYGHGPQGDVIRIDNFARCVRTVTTCAGKPATIVGTPGDDVLTGTALNDVIWGGGGDDDVSGRGGDDLICLGGGDDAASGGLGDDVIYGGRGVDALWGNRGTDRRVGGKAADVLRGGAGRDRLLGNGGIDDLFGQGGNDVLKGGFGTDSGNGGWGVDRCRALESTTSCER